MQILRTIFIALSIEAVVEDKPVLVVNVQLATANRTFSFAPIEQGLSVLIDYS